MNLTLLGFIIIAISIALTFNRKWFFVWYGFSCVLDYVSIFNSVGSLIKPHYFTTLILMFFINKRAFKGIHNRPFFVWIIIFLLFIVFSNIISIFLDGTVFVLSNDSKYKDLDALVPLSRNSNGYLNMIFPFFNFFQLLCVYLVVRSREDILNMLKGFFFNVYSLAIFVILSYVLQVSNQFAVIESILLFLNPGHARDITLSYGAVGDILRIYTYIGEPGYTARFYTLIIFAGILGKLFVVDTRFNFLPNTFFIFTYLIFLIFLGSTAGYLGIFMYGFILLYIFPYKNRLLKIAFNFSLLLPIFFLISIILYFSFQNSVDFFFTYLLDHLDKLKGESGSGENRLENILYSLNHVLPANFLTGVGYGNHRVSSFILLLLVNTGILGLLIFTFTYSKIYKFNLRKNMIIGHNDYFLVIFFQLNLLAFFVYYFFLAVAPFNFGWVWLFAGLFLSLKKVLTSLYSSYPTIRN